MSENNDAPSGLVDAVRAIITTVKEAIAVPIGDGVKLGTVRWQEILADVATLDATLSGQQGGAVPAGDLPSVEAFAEALWEEDREWPLRIRRWNDATPREVTSYHDRASKLRARLAEQLVPAAPGADGVGSQSRVLGKLTLEQGTRLSGLPPEAIQFEADELLALGSAVAKRGARSDGGEGLRQAAQEVLTSIDVLIEDSEGVFGLHRNGDVAPWSELTAGGRYDSWLGSLEVLRARLAEQPAPAEKENE